ncbi:hypothetical protein RFI_22961 [Reticulomyxa filosa]|uniref:Vacuolar protein 14 C-terminal Fig4-binding domain-containing protein n=1 Tax=Reticulomyxa filosa TaxID=46433 RepID=X6MLB8_RETFI|nr:hypothetical protein RFI_22961 [Reticulomyxa filosa]|eukprot:ETO14406.1 hypothetical protein RFI_22961 [Reticulomyxa filosa]
MYTFTHLYINILIHKVYELLEILREALESDFVETKIAALDWICMMLVNLNLDLKEIEEKSKLFPVLLSLLCDADDQVVELTLTVLSQISINDKYFHLVCVNLLVVFKERTNLLAVRGKFITEKLCELLGATKVYVALVDKLVSEEVICRDLEFCSLMVQSLNLILLTTDTKPMEELRLQIKSCQETPENWKLFTTLFVFLLYFVIAKKKKKIKKIHIYIHTGSRLVWYFANLDMTVGFLMQIDKLISLIESPTFVHMRLQLLEPQQHPQLLKILYGLLMLLPQNSAFNNLRLRLHCASSFGLLDCAPNATTNKKVALLQSQSQNQLKQDKFKVDVDTLFEQFITVQNNFRRRRLAEISEATLPPREQPTTTNTEAKDKVLTDSQNKTEEQKMD